MKPKQAHGEVNVAKLFILVVCLCTYLLTTGCGSMQGAYNSMPPTPVTAEESEILTGPSEVFNPPAITGAHSESPMPTSELPKFDDYTIDCADDYIAEVSKERVKSIPSGEDYVYSIILKQGKDDSTYQITVRRSLDAHFKVIICNKDGDEIQTIIDDREACSTDIVDFIDVNLDGYADIQINFGGTLNELHKIYVWSPESQKFVAVQCEADIFYYEVHDGYIENMPKESARIMIIQKLVWKDGDTLVLESEERIDLAENIEDKMT